MLSSQEAEMRALWPSARISTLCRLRCRASGASFELNNPGHETASYGDGVKMRLTLGSALLLLAMVPCLFGVTSPVRPRSAVHSVPRPPTSQVLTPPHTAQQPSAVPLTASTVRRAATAKKEADAKVEARRSVNAALSGMDLVTSPNVFRGMSASGELLEMPQKLGREEELELVQHALFFIASNDAERALAERAREEQERCSALADAADAEEEIALAGGRQGRQGRAAMMHSVAGACSTEFDADRLVFNHIEILDEMRRAAEEAVARGEAARKQGKTKATEVPCEVPADVSDTEYRVLTAMGRAAYNKLFHHHQRLIYYEVNKVWGGKWKSASVMEKADFLQEGAQGLLRAIRLFDVTRGVRFSTYASWHVRAFVLRALRDKSHIVRLPQTLQTDMMQIRKARYRYAVENQGHVPSDSALAEMLSWPPSRVVDALKGLASASATSLDAETMAPAGSSLSTEPMMSRVASPKHDSVAAENELYQTQLKKSLRKAMADRDPRRIQITRLKYGLEDGIEWTYPQIAERFNLTANVAKGIVRAEVNFLRRAKKHELQDFVGHSM